ncbi:PHB depolymerase family esterase [Aliikangiella sp. G2MR2-5]|uniref:carboxylesterase family protein n=1 Tax=Aliikangiella sp. G2MR2-5 TaxID=2788943 RepID=UPI001AEE9C0A|nr:PHB depolymerase family esterase [Aliikangiella sp. G2MR2-5]
MESLIENFYQANDVKESLNIADSIIAEAHGLEQIYPLLRAYKPKAFPISKHFYKKASKRNDGLSYLYAIEIPENYDAKKNYPVVFLLHGGVRRQKWKMSQTWWPRDVSNGLDDYIKIYPTGWHKSLWWSPQQVDNILEILAEVKRSYNVDTSRVYLSGLSDGASGSYFIASRLPDLFAAVAPVIGSPSVLADKKNGISEETYPVNLTNTPFLSISADKDTLYKPKDVEPYIRYFQHIGVNIQFVVTSGYHNFKPFKNELNRILEFFSKNIRQTTEKHLVLQVDESFNRKRSGWVVVNSLSQKEKGSPVKGLLESKKKSGLIEVRAENNDIYTYTKGIGSFTLLFSKEQFNFDKPVRIFHNDHLIVSRNLTPDIKTLLNWAAKDKDPQRLFVAQMEFKVSS